MKKMRRTWAILLALVLTVALAVPGFAAEGGYSITITNDKAGHTYEAYQIFAGTVASDDEQNVGGGDGITGPMLGNIIWGTGVDGVALLAALRAADAEKYGACTTAADVAEALGAEGATAADAAAFAEVVSGFLAAAPTGQTDTHVENARYVIDGLPAGYYLVKDQDRSLEGDADTATEYIVQVLGNVTMEPKDSDIPTVEKKVVERGKYNQDGGYGMYYNDVADWNIGDRVPFKLIGSIPDMTAYETYEYTFTDTISAGLTLDMESFDVYVAQNKNQDPVALGWTEIPAANYTLTQTENGFTLTIEDLKNFPYVTEEGRNYILVFYDAILNENADIGLDGNPNSVYLEFSNNPNGEGLGRTNEDTVIVFTYELDGTKVDGENHETLQDAEFVLLNSARTTAAAIVDGKVSGWVQVHSEAAAGDITRPESYEEWVERYGESNVIITSGTDGVFNISGLDDGTYYLREIKAPDGYNLLEDDLKIVITATTANGQTWNGDAATALTALTVTTKLGDEEAVAPVAGDTTDGAVAITVENNGGSTLPETGGIGTTIFYAAGALLVLCAGVLLFVKLRMRKAGDE